MQGIAANSITGLVSGLDTAAIVDAIIGVERGNTRLMEARQVETTNMISAYRAAEARFLAIQTRLASLDNVATFDKMTYDISDANALSVTGFGDAAPGSYEIQVLQLALSHQIAAQGVDDPEAATLGTGTFLLSVGDSSQQTITITSANNSLMGLKDAINAAGVGVSATIINDGTSRNAYRLLLSSNKTGAENKINVTSSLTGGINLDFSSSSFDTPETDGFSALGTSAVSLGSTAAYTGTENKTYTFTVAGSGTQIVGSDIITLNWTDGTNSGSIVVTQADIEETLSGTGSDGLTLQLSAGDVVGGDSFTVSTFAPILQNPQDAKISVGSSSTGGSPITISSASGVFEGALAGMSITAKKVTEDGSVVTIKAERNIAGIRSEIDGFISAYNDAMKFIDGQFKYDVVKKSAGILMSDSLLRVMQESIRSAATGVVSDVTSGLNTLATIGIRSDSQGLLKIANSSLLEKAINESLDDLKRLFSSNIISSRPEVEFLTSSDATKPGQDYGVDITQIATHGQYDGAYITDPATTDLVIDSDNNTLTLKIDGVSSNSIVLTEGTYTSFDQLVREVQKKLDADDKVGKLGVIVSYELSGATGKLIFTSGSYGSHSSITLLSEAESAAGHTLLGLIAGSALTGKDVAGTINGEEATGSGQILTGKDGNDTTEGLKVKVTFAAIDLGDGDEATITVTKGIASKLKDTLFRIVDSADGSLSRRVKGLDLRVKDLLAQIKHADERLVLRRQRLIDQFNQMEQVLGQLNAQGSFLANGLAALSNK